MKHFYAFVLIALSLDHGHCQEIARPAFEVASITPSAPGTPQPASEHSGVAQFTFPGGRFNARATTVNFLLEWAYGIQPSQHAGGPAWLSTDRYDIAAKADENATAAQMKLMAQTLLADRFQLKLHREQRELSAYVISVGKTAPRLTPAKEGETYGIGMSPQMSAGKLTAYRVSATRFTLAQLSDVFSRQLGGVIVNHTGLDGEYDFTLELTPNENQPNFLDPTLLISALREQLGLTLKSQKLPLDVLVVDSAEKVAAGN